MKYRIVILTTSLMLLLPGISWSLDDVVPQTGGLIVTQKDIRLPTALGPVAVERSYDQNRESGILGPHWSLAIASSLERPDERHLVLAQGHRVSVLAQSDNTDLYAGTGGITGHTDGDRWIVNSPAGITSVYNVNGREVSRSDANGNVISFAYDGKGRLSGIRAVKNHPLSLIYNEKGLLAALQLSSGRKSSYFYTAEGYLEKVKDSDGWETTYTYTRDGKLSRIQYPSGETVDYTYDGNGKVTERVSSTGLLLKYAYGPATKVTRHDGYWWETEFDGTGLPMSYRDSLKREQSWSWNSRGLLEKRIFLDGMTTTYSYDERDRLTRRESNRGDSLTINYEGKSDRPLKADFNGAIHQFSYDRKGNLLSMISPAGRKVSCRYDDHGRVSAGVDGEGRTTKFEYDERGNLVRQFNPDGGVTTWEYDPDGRLTAERDPLGNTTGYAYHTNGLLASITRPGGACIEYAYDDHGRLSRETYGTFSIRYTYDTKGMLSSVEYPGKASEQFRYDTSGNLLAYSDAAGRATRREYDHAGRLIRLELPSGLLIGQSWSTSGVPEQLTIGRNKYLFLQNEEENTTVLAGPENVEARLVHDSRGLVTQKTLPGGGLEQRWYDDDGFLEAMVLPMGDVWRFSHNGAGELQTITYPSYPEGKQFTFAYDPAGRLATINDPSGRLASYRYDKAGMLIESTNARGQGTRCEYDGDGNMTRRRTPESDWRYAYDRFGNLTRASNGSYTVLYSYDGTGQMTNVEYPEWKKRVGYAYDTLGRLTARTDPDGSQVRTAYDERGRVREITGPGGRSFVFSYDGEDRLVRRKAPNGTVTTFVYDPDDRVASITHTGPDGTALASHACRYDAMGNVIAVSGMTGRGKTFRYDREQRLIEETGPSGTIKYLYGPGGNRLLVEKDSGLIKYLYDESGRLIRAGGTTLAYDADGNLTEKKTKDGTTRYRYDAGNNLVEARMPDGGTVKYGYGPFGERVWREENGKRQYFLYDGHNVLQELTAARLTSRTYLFAGLDRPLMGYSPDDMTVFHEDPLGNIIALSDSGGKLSAHDTYDAFGNVVQRDGSAEGPPFCFNGRPIDPALHLYDLRARFYDPGTGRFISRDPVIGDIDDPVTLVPYLYARNNPAGYVDHTGEKPQKANPGRSDQVWDAVKKHAPAVGSGVAFVPKVPEARPATVPPVPGAGGSGGVLSSLKTAANKLRGSYKRYQSHVNLNPTRSLSQASTVQTVTEIAAPLTTPIVDVVLGEETDVSGAVLKTAENVVVKGAPVAAVAATGKGLALAFPGAAAALAPAAPYAIMVGICVCTVDRVAAAINEGIAWNEAEKEFQKTIQDMKDTQASLAPKMAAKAQSILGQLADIVNSLKKRTLELIQERAWIEQQLKDEGSKKQELVKDMFQKTLRPLENRLPQLEASLKNQDLVFPVVEPFAEVIEKMADDACEIMKKQGNAGIEAAQKMAQEAETEADKLKEKITADAKYDSTIQAIDDLIAAAESEEANVSTVIDNAKGEIEWVRTRVDRIWKNYNEFQGLRADVQRKQTDLMRHINLLETQLKTIKRLEGEPTYREEDFAALDSYKRVASAAPDDMGAPLNANEYMSGMDLEIAGEALNKIKAFKTKANDLRAKIEKQRDLDGQLKERIDLAVARAKACAGTESLFAGTWKATFIITYHSRGIDTDTIGTKVEGFFTINKEGDVYSVDGFEFTEVNSVKVTANILTIEGTTRMPIKVDTPSGTVTYEEVVKDTVRLWPGEVEGTLLGKGRTDFIREGRVDEWHEQSIIAVRQ